MSGMLRIVVALCLFFQLISALPHPGKVILWSNNNEIHTSEYTTKSMEIPQAMNAISELSKNYELIVVLNSANELDTAFVKDTVTKSGDLKVFNYVYPSKEHSVIANSLSQHLAGHSIKESHEMKSILDNKNNLLSNNVPDVVHVASNDMSNIFQQAISKEIPSELQSKILFVSYTEIPSTQTTSSRRLSAGDYTTLLLDTMDAATTATTSSDIADGIFYSPEGSEFAIFYADTYLYITPDIFTGIMTGLFMFFTILIGVTCLGQIQGMSSFYDRIPQVGREA
jgi:hypothetical protein